jgi:serine kinase of HPr protein (carbohydrate metabolism regulator)
MSETLHASAVLLRAGGVMLCGPSGSGKSSLCAALIEMHEARLIGDDRLIIESEAEDLFAAPHDNLRGLLEVVGLGLLRLPFEARATINLVVDLTPLDARPRLADEAYFEHRQARVPLIYLDGHSPHGALKIKLALQALKNGFRDDAIYDYE